MLYGALINLQYVISCGVFFFKYGDYKDIKNISILAVTFFLILLTIIYFYKDPSEFDFFWYSFHKEKIRSHHFFIYLFVLISASLLMILLPKLNFLAILPLLLLIFFTIIVKPYMNRKENYRSCFNLFIMCCFIGLKTWI